MLRTSARKCAPMLQFGRSAFSIDVISRVSLDPKNLLLFAHAFYICISDACTQRPTGVNLEGENFLLKSVGGLNLTGKYGTRFDNGEEDKTPEGAATRNPTLERRHLRPATWKQEPGEPVECTKSGKELLDEVLKERDMQQLKAVVETHELQGLHLAMDMIEHVERDERNVAHAFKSNGAAYKHWIAGSMRTASPTGPDILRVSRNKTQAESPTGSIQRSTSPARSAELWQPGSGMAAPVQPLDASQQGATKSIYASQKSAASSLKGSALTAQMADNVTDQQRRFRKERVALLQKVSKSLRRDQSTGGIYVNIAGHFPASPFSSPLPSSALLCPPLVSPPHHLTAHDGETRR